MNSNIEEIEVRAELRPMTTHVIRIKTFPEREWIPVFYGNERDANFGAVLLRGVLTSLRLINPIPVINNKVVRRVEGGAA